MTYGAIFLIGRLTPTLAGIVHRSFPSCLDARTLGAPPILAMRTSAEGFVLRHCCRLPLPRPIHRFTDRRGKFPRSSLMEQLFPLARPVSHEVAVSASSTLIRRALQRARRVPIPFQHKPLVTVLAQPPFRNPRAPSLAGSIIFHSYQSLVNNFFPKFQKFLFLRYHRMNLAFLSAFLRKIPKK